MPQTLHRRPIQLTVVPVKVNVTVASVTSELPAVPPLKEATSGPRRTQASVALARMAGLPLQVKIAEADRKYHWPLGRRPDDHPGLSTFGF